MALTKEQFKAQFPVEIEFSHEIGCDPSMLRFEREYLGYNVYRALDKLVLEDEDGKLFIRA